jgi:hypothetical protein
MNINLARLIQAATPHTDTLQYANELGSSRYSQKKSVLT